MYAVNMCAPLTVCIVALVTIFCCCCCCAYMQTSAVLRCIHLFSFLFPFCLHCCLHCCWLFRAFYLPCMARCCRQPLSVSVYAAHFSMPQRAYCFSWHTCRRYVLLLHTVFVLRLLLLWLFCTDSFFLCALFLWHICVYVCALAVLCTQTGAQCLSELLRSAFYIFTFSILHLCFLL